MLRISLGLVLGLALWGQGGNDHLAFEVASIKPSAKQGLVTRITGGPRTSDPGLFRATN